MSAFVCIFHRDGSSVETGDLGRLVEPLASHGEETTTCCRGPFGLAVRHLRGSGSPVEDPSSGTVSALAGHGPHPLVEAELRRGEVRITRDPLGSVGVYYVVDDARLLAASEPAALLAHPAVPSELDEGSVARFLGFRFGADDRSFFRRIRKLPPAHRLRVTESETVVEPYWRFRRLPSAADRSLEDLAEELRRRLERSVAEEIGDLEPSRVAVSLSGGLDSAAVAAVAPRGVRAFSWTFDETPEADERPRIEAISRRLGLAVHWISGDGLYPLGDDFVDRFVHRGSPHVNPFAALKCRLYEAAHDAGCHRVLVGDGGDALYASWDYWLRDLLVDRRPGALRSLAAAVGGTFRGNRAARRALRRLVPLGELRRPPWWTRALRTALPPPVSSPILPEGRGSQRYELSVGAKHSELESEERRLALQCGVERADPFWSPALLEPMMQLRAYRYHRDGRHKLLTRRALRELLAQGIVEGPAGGSLGSFFLRGIELRRESLREMVFRHPHSDWPRYVRREWLEPYLDETRSISFGHTILWRVISYELWRRRLEGNL